MYTFKSNSSKSNAKRFLVQTAKVADFEKYLTQDGDGAWGTYLNDDGRPVTSEEVRLHMENKIAALAAEVNAATSSPEPEQEEEAPAAPAPSPNAFSAFAMAQLTAPSNNVQAAEPAKDKRQQAASTGVKIEKNRETRNNVTRPSAGTTCATVWDLCGEMTASKGSTVALSELVEEAIKRQINQFTARTQYARWRAFNGIKDRVTRAG